MSLNFKRSLVVGQILKWANSVCGSIWTRINMQFYCYCIFLFFLSFNAKQICNSWSL